MVRRKLNAPTSYNVALHAGVSQAAVSRAFQAVSPISADTRARILASAAELGYQPNAVARSLITKRSGLAGVLLTEATQRDTPELLKAYMANFDPSFVALRTTPDKLSA